MADPCLAFKDHGQECSCRNIMPTCLGERGPVRPVAFKPLGLRRRRAAWPVPTLVNCNSVPAGTPVGDQRSIRRGTIPPRPGLAEPKMFLQEHIAARLAGSNWLCQLRHRYIWMGIHHKLQKCSCRNTVENSATCRLIGRLHSHRMPLLDHFGP